jgi:hypothetical protein
VLALAVGVGFNVVAVAPPFSNLAILRSNSATLDSSTLSQLAAANTKTASKKLNFMVFMIKIFVSISNY